jgi:hypothetical protein
MDAVADYSKRLSFECSTASEVRAVGSFEDNYWQCEFGLVMKHAAYSNFRMLSHRQTLELVHTSHEKYLQRSNRRCLQRLNLKGYQLPPPTLAG